jgi:hypothetical protein
MIYLISHSRNLIFRVKCFSFTVEFFHQYHCKLRSFYPAYAMIKSLEANDFASFQQKLFWIV